MIYWIYSKKLWASVFIFIFYIPFQQIWTTSVSKYANWLIDIWICKMQIKNLPIFYILFNIYMGYSKRTTDISTYLNIFSVNFVSFNILHLSESFWRKFKGRKDRFSDLKVKMNMRTTQCYQKLCHRKFRYNIFTVSQLCHNIRIFSSTPHSDLSSTISLVSLNLFVL